MRVLESKLDASFNVIMDPIEGPGKFESRFVQREGYSVVYLSSQSGCKWGCQFCHLTATGQTQYVNADYNDFQDQARSVLVQMRAPDLLHWNFMARGEPLDNQFVNDELFDRLIRLYDSEHGDWQDKPARMRFNISTIMPRSFTSFYTRFRYHQPDIYYSLYSMDPAFRAEWLPGAMDPDKALRHLTDWQQRTHKIPKIHFAFIEGENDSFESVRKICQAIESYRIHVNFNIVRYNPPNTDSWETAEEVIEAHVQYMRDRLNCNVDIIQRVGYDVKASCGMFVNGSEEP